MQQETHNRGTYRYLEDIAIADVAFEAQAPGREGLFIAASDALVNVMVEDPAAIDGRVPRRLAVDDEAVDMLLFGFLQELIYLKDAQDLLLRVRSLGIESRNDKFYLEAQAFGEKIDPKKHALKVDVKAVTLHRFSVTQSKGLWRAVVVLDI
jgi:SHS2 domain-containing protein